MKTKKFTRNLFQESITLAKKEETEETLGSRGDRTLAAWTASNPHRSRECASYWIDASLADRLVEITEEVRDMLPFELQDRFHVSTIAELIFASIVDEYDGRSFKTSTVLAQLIRFWISQNEPPVEKN